MDHSSQEIMEGLTIRIEHVKNGKWMKLCRR